MNGTVTSPHPLASAAGADVLANGGNAIEAAIAIGAVLTVVCPHFCGLGGDAVWMIADGSGQVDCILGIGQAAARARAGESIPNRGPDAALTTAGLVDAWRLALEHSEAAWQGRVTFSELLSPAETLAREGFPITKSQRFWLDFRRTELSGWPGFAEIFCPSARMLEPGDYMFQPQLAETFAELRGSGPREFYEGALAARVAAGLEIAGTPIRLADLAATRARWAEPLRISYRDTDLFAPPPPTQGLATLEAMGILNHFAPDEFGAEGSATHFHLVIEAIKQAFIDRKQIADRQVSEIADLLSTASLKSAVQRIDKHTALRWPHVFEEADTVFFGAADAKGRCASVLQSTYFDWGSGVVAGDTGIIWHNRGAAFDPDPQALNGLVAGRLPFHTLNPGIALRKGKPFLVYGSQGADGQPQNLTLLLTRLIDFALAPAEALGRPRFLLGKTFSDAHETLKLEENATQEVFAELAASGHDLATLPALSPLAGQAGIIRLDEDRAEGAHDPRGEGAALTIESA